MLQGDFLSLFLLKFDFFNKDKVFDMGPNHGKILSVQVLYLKYRWREKSSKKKRKYKC
jgi:hypothetical protein